MRLTDNDLVDVSFRAFLSNVVLFRDIQNLSLKLQRTRMNMSKISRAFNLD